MNKKEKQPTEKQIIRFTRIINYFGEDHVKKYFYHFFPYGNLQDMTRMQAQKVITGLGNSLPRSPLRRVDHNEAYWRDEY